MVQSGKKELASSPKIGVRPYVWFARMLLERTDKVKNSAGALTILVAILSVVVALFFGFSTQQIALTSNGLLELDIADGFNFSRSCSQGMNKSAAHKALLLAGHFLLYSQTKQGSFLEQYHWENRTGVPAIGAQADAETQAMALWALSSMYRQVRQYHKEYPKGLQTRLHEAIILGVSYLESHSRTTASGARFIILPGDKFGRMSVVAEVIISLVDVMRSLETGRLPKGVGLNAPSFRQTTQYWRLSKLLDEHVSFLLKMRLPNGRFLNTYEATGRPRESPAPHVKQHAPSSEALAALAMVVAAKHRGRADLWPKCKQSLDAITLAYAPTTGDVEKETQSESSARTKQFFHVGGLALLEAGGVDDGGEEERGAGKVRVGGESAEAVQRLLELGWHVASAEEEGGAKGRLRGVRALGAAPSLFAAGWAARAVSRGAGLDLEWEWSESLSCGAMKLLSTAGTRQLGGPLADPKEAQMAKAPYGYSPASAPDFKFNVSKCHRHVTRAASGSVVAKRDRIKKEAEEEKLASQRAGQVHITPGEPVSLGDMMRQASAQKAENPTRAPELSECERAKHAHDRCTNDNPPGKHGFFHCCRALAGLLFACAEDFKLLPAHQRSLYVPSYTHFCVPSGHAPLPQGYAKELTFERVSEFVESKREAEADGCDLAALGGVKGEGEQRGTIRLDDVSSFVLGLSWAASIVR